MKAKKSIQRSSRVNLVMLTVEISQRSRSTVYNVLNGKMRSQPVETAMAMARELLERQRREVEEMRAKFAAQFPPNHNGESTRGNRNNGEGV